MCLITTQKTALIAEKNITVYKVICKDLSAIFQEFKYDINVLYETKIKASEQWDVLGVHDEWLFDNYPDNSWRRHPDLICLGEGFHSIKDKENAFILKNQLYLSVIVFKCVIPKGSEYYIDASGLIISNKIILKKQINE